MFFGFCIAEKRVGFIIKEELIYLYLTKKDPIAKQMRKFFLVFLNNAMFLF